MSQKKKTTRGNPAKNATKRPRASGTFQTEAESTSPGVAEEASRLRLLAAVLSIDDDADDPTGSRATMKRDTVSDLNNLQHEIATTSDIDRLMFYGQVAIASGMLWVQEAVASNVRTPKETLWALANFEHLRRDADSRVTQAVDILEKISQHPNLLTDEESFVEVVMLQGEVEEWKKPRQFNEVELAAEKIRLAGRYKEYKRSIRDSGPPFHGTVFPTERDEDDGVFYNLFRMHRETDMRHQPHLRDIWEQLKQIAEEPRWRDLVTEVADDLEANQRTPQDVLIEIESFRQ